MQIQKHNRVSAIPGEFDGQPGIILANEWSSYINFRHEEQVRYVHSGDLVPWNMSFQVGLHLGSYEEWASKGGYMVLTHWKKSGFKIVIHPRIHEVRKVPCTLYPPAVTVQGYQNSR